MKKLKAYLKETPHIRYSNCHEDTDFALAHIKGNPETILSIASGLDNSLAFLLLNPKQVTAIDSNEAQIYLCNLKKCAIEHLGHQDFLNLIGMKTENSEKIYNGIREYLDEDTRAYFDSHIYLISEIGLINCGKFEYYFQLFRKHILPKTHSRRTVDAFMSADTLEKQNEVFKKRFNNFRLRFLFRIFFSKAVMKKYGREKLCFEYAKGNLSSALKGQFDSCIRHNLNINNPYLQYIIKGRMDTMPTYLVKENYEIIKKNIHKLEIRKAEFSDVMKENQTYDFMYLSDIFEYMSEEETSLLAEEIYEKLETGGQALLYNMMIERHLSPKLTQTELDQNTNRTFYYRHCYHYEKR